MQLLPSRGAGGGDPGGAGDGVQVPLVVFKREKEIARKLEFDGLYITEQPSDDDIKGQWDRLVINTP